MNFSHLMFLFIPFSAIRANGVGFVWTTTHVLDSRTLQADSGFHLFQYNMIMRPFENIY